MPAPKNNIYATGLPAAGQEEIMSASTGGYAQRQLSGGGRLYTPDEFSDRVQYLSRDQLAILINAIKQESDQIIAKRTSAAQERARQHYREYGHSTPAAVTSANCIVEALLDSWWRKGPENKIDRIEASKQIQGIIDRHEPIEMVLRIFPTKVGSPIKTSGTTPDLAEAISLNILYMVSGTVNRLYEAEDRLRGRDHDSRQRASFTVLTEGTRWTKAWNLNPKDNETYVQGLHWWIEQFGFSQHITLKDNDVVLHNALSKIIDLSSPPPEMSGTPLATRTATRTLNEKHTELLQSTRAQYERLMLPIFDPFHLQETLKRASERDPIPDDKDARGRFVALFESTLYSTRHVLLEEYAERHQLPYDELYQTIARHIDKPFTGKPLTPQEETDVLAYALTPDGTQAPSPELVMECMRVQMLKTAWDATIEYVSKTYADRTLGTDPVLLAMPEAVRATIHPKQGQFALNTTGTRGGAAVESWHGTGFVKEEKADRTRVGINTRLALEANGGIPVCIHPDEGNKRFLRCFDVAQQLAATQQPLLYLLPTGAGGLPFLEKIKHNGPLHIDMARR